MTGAPTIFAVWSAPRCLSTALMYAFAQRQDTRVLDEPLFGYFLDHTGVERPSRQEALQQMDHNASRIFSSFKIPDDRPYLFLKNMANHCEGLSLSKIENFRNVVLTRHPAKVLASYTAQVKMPSMLDLGYAHKLAILRHLKKKDLPLLVVESDELASTPERELQRLCRYFEIPFQSGMLHWPPGPRREDGVWAKYWYHNLHNSTGFVAPSKTKKYQVPPALNDLYRQCLEYYQQIKTYE